MDASNKIDLSDDAPDFDDDMEKSDEYEYYYVYYDEDGNVVNKTSELANPPTQQELQTAQVQARSIRVHGKRRLTWSENRKHLFES